MNEDTIRSTVHEIWCRSLGLIDIGADDDFVAIGGDSVSALQMSFEVAERFGLEAEQIYGLDEGTTLNELTSCLAKRLRHAAA